MENLYNYYYSQAIKLLNDHKFKLAKKYFKEAYKYKKNEISLLKMYALTEYKLNNFSKANELCHKAFLINRNDIDVANNYALSLIWINNYALAEKIFINCIECNPTHAPTLGNYGKFLMQLKRYKDALEVFTKIENYQQIYDIVINIANCQYALDNIADAKKYFNLALNLNPSDLNLQEFIKKFT